MGQTKWNSSADVGQGQNYIVNPVLAAELAHQAREMSNFGKMSAPVGDRIYMDGGRNSTSADAGSPMACIWTKSMKPGSGDEVRFTLIENLTGAPTYGDAPVQLGGYLSYLHANMRFNKIDSPAYPLQEEMQRWKVDSILGNEEAEIKSQGLLWFAQEYAAEVIRGFLYGRSNAVRLAKTQGALADDMGRGLDDEGNGKKVSCENVIILGATANGGAWLSPTASNAAGLNSHETNIATALASLDAYIGSTSANAAESQPNRSFASEIREAISNKLFEAVGGAADLGGKWYVACDPAAFYLLTNTSSELFALWKTAQNTGSEERKNLFNLPDFVEIDDIVFFREPMLRYFRLSAVTATADAGKGVAGYGVSGAINNEFSYGGTIADFRGGRPTFVGGAASATGATWGHMLVLGRGGVLEGTGAGMEVTKENGEHGKGASVAFHQKFGLKRRVYIPQDGRIAAPFNRTTADILFRLPLTSRYGAI